jgi:hypothetical protein
MQTVYSIRAVLIAALTAAFALQALQSTADEPDPAVRDTESRSTGSVAWLNDYHAALEEAERQGRLALLWFCDPALVAENERLEAALFVRPAIREIIASGFVPVRLPIDAVVSSAGQQVALFDHPAFSEMRRSPGLAIVDMTDTASPLHRQVVSVYPFRNGPISADKLAVLLDLPRGTLTQRTLIFAVRTHPELPQSASGGLSPVLRRETELHAGHQAQIALQGHHNWSARFQAINDELSGGLVAREVCAESWPGQNLIEAAVECVHSWRQSSGHWDAVRSRHTAYGYDMKRGRNGVWYAAGIFASPR